MFVVQVFLCGSVSEKAPLVGSSFCFMLGPNTRKKTEIEQERSKVHLSTGASASSWSGSNKAMGSGDAWEVPVDCSIAPGPSYRPLSWHPCSLP